MADGVLFLPFLPMLPTKILLNNLLYDISETTVPLESKGAGVTVDIATVWWEPCGEELPQHIIRAVFSTGSIAKCTG